MPTKIFVAGRNRSGTKWLSNLIAENNNVAAMQRKRAYGLIESNLFIVFPQLFKGIRNEDNYRAFKMLFTETNMFKASGLRKKDFFSKRYHTIYEVLDNFLEQYTSSKGVDFALQKADSIVLPKMMEKFPKAKIVIIQRRNVVDNVLSNTLLNNEKIRYGNLVLHIFSYWHHRKIENSFKNYDNVKIVTFENLKGDRKQVLKAVCNFTGLSYSDSMLESKYKKNTTYRNKNKKDFDTKKTRSIIYIISFFASLVPLWLYRISFKIKEFIKNLSSKDKKMFLPLTFQLYNEEMNGREEIANKS